MSEPKSGTAILVTGASRGLGLETCRQLGKKGLRVILTARDPGAGRAAAERLAGEGIDAAFRPLDVTSAASIAALAKSLAADGITLGGLVNNAAVALDGFDGTVARKTIDANFFGPLRVTDGLLGALEDGANIVMVSSGAGELSGFPEGLRKRFLDPALTREGLIDLVESFVAAVADGRYAKLGWPGSAYRVSKAGPECARAHPLTGTRRPSHPRQRRLSRLGADRHGRRSCVAERRKRRGLDRLGGDAWERRADRRLLS